MPLDELTLDEDETWGASIEVPSLQSEKQKEASHRAQVQLQKTQKDEKKAKWDNDDLFLLLARFIKTPLYEPLIPSIVVLLQHAYPSRFVLFVTALVYPEAAHYLFQKIQQEIPTHTFTNLHHYPELHVFHNDDIDPSLRDWVTLWMSSGQKLLSDRSSSVILTHKLILLLSSPERSLAKKSISTVFQYFFLTKNVSIDSTKADTYADFIVSQIEQDIVWYLSESDREIYEATQIEANMLFGF